MDAQLVERMVASLQVPRDRLLEFFVGFSRFEYALKAAGYTKDPPRTSDVSWDKFVNWLETLPSTEVIPLILAGRYLLDEPPKTLIILPNGDPTWVVRGHQGRSDVWLLIDGLRRARNNLFHGGKWLTAPLPPDRNHLVIATGIGVLSALTRLPSAGDLCKHFEEL